jgi:hypothetical protein
MPPGSDCKDVSAKDVYAKIAGLGAALARGSLRAIARALDERGIKTRHGWPHWSAQQVRRVLARAGA